MKNELFKLKYDNNNTFSIILGLKIKFLKFRNEK